MMAEDGKAGVSSRTEKKAFEREKILQREKERKILRLIRHVLKKPEAERSEEETAVLLRHKDTVEDLSRRHVRRNVLKKRQEEVFDEPEELSNKVRQLAQVIKQANHLVVYTGAGISTAASIPDYRGPNGVWTQLQRGCRVSSTDLSRAEPTLTHMSIRKLHTENMVKHVVSQNCDGLHLRSGLPRSAMSELHGNMFIEVCITCSPVREYIRLFDVTERTSLHRHGTGRKCSQCGNELRDTIVHFGERGTLEQPLNWKGASVAAELADVILCLGSSLKVLKKYNCLWCMNKPASKRPRLYIINLQWTVKDNLADLKINAKCDDVMALLMKELNLDIPGYERAQDPIFSLVTPLLPGEEDSHNREVITLELRPQEGVAETETGHAEETTLHQVVQGGWFGRGYGKGRRKKKKTV